MEHKACYHSATGSEQQLDKQLDAGLGAATVLTVRHKTDDPSPLLVLMGSC